VAKPKKADIEAEPSPDFVAHLRGRLGVDEPTAAATLACWVSTYEPGPLALARAGTRSDRKQSAAA
jgi:hypothetical protein